MARNKNELTDEIRTFIVQALACFDPPSVVVAAVKDEFGRVTTPQAVQAYDPTKHAGKKIAKKWREMFDATRKAFIDNTATIGISHKATRLRALERMAIKAEKQGNIALAVRLHEQAAKEVGNAYTNKVDLTSSDGSMSPPSLADFYGAMKKKGEE